jgi:hypothetical protein
VTPLRVVTLLARHGTQRYADAVSHVDAIFETQLPTVDRELVVIDNSLPKDYVEMFGRCRTLLGSCNASWEFSAWDRGIEYLGHRIHQFDFVHLVTSAFKALECHYLDLFDTTMLGLIGFGQPAALGHIDAYMDPIVLLGRSSQAWLRSSWIFLPPREVDLLGSFVGVHDRSAFFSGNPAAPFHKDAPISANYQQYILEWQTGGGVWTGDNEWHSRFDLSVDTLAHFETKALAIMNEQILSLRLRRQGCAMVDADWLALRRTELSPEDALGVIPNWRSQLRARGSVPELVS